MENAAPVLMVDDLDAWKKTEKRFIRTCKGMGAITSLLSLVFLASSAYWAGVVFPLLRGDISFGHPGYYAYRSESDMALLFVVASLVLYYGAGMLFRHHIRKGYVALGMTREGTFANVRQSQPVTAGE